MSRSSAPAAALLAGFLVLFAHAAAGLEAPAIERPAPDRIEIRWSGPDPVDVYLAARPETPLAKAGRVAHAARGGDLILPWTSDARPYVILRDERDGSIARSAERLLPLQQGSNFRDLGGYPAAGGRHVRWGLIYRAAATPMLTDADFGYLARLGIAEDIDLRTIEERRLVPDALPARTGARYFARDYPANDDFGRLAAGQSTPGGVKAAVAGLYRSWLVSLAPQYREIFRSLLAGKGAVAFHCSAGQDRSGVAAALILSALGVPRPVILEDFHLSTRDRRPEFEMPPIDAAAHPGDIVAQYYARAQAAGPMTAKPLYDAQGRAYLEQTFEEIDARWGSVPAYLDQELGVDRAAIARLRALYLD